MERFGCLHACIQDPSEVVVSACSSVLEIYAALHAPRCRYKDVEVIEYLVHNACFHHLRLGALLKALSRSKLDKSKKKPLKMEETEFDNIWNIGGNKFHYLQRHLSIIKRDMGSDMNTFDTQHSEHGHISLVKEGYKVSNRMLNLFYFPYLLILFQSLLITCGKGLVEARIHSSNRDLQPQRYHEGSRST